MPFKTRQMMAYEMAHREVGLKEIAGPRDEAKIVNFFAEVGHDWVKDDETAWCAAFVGAMLERAGLPSTRKLDARSYLRWGDEIQLENARPGDIVVFYRGDPNGWQGHVGFFVSKTATKINVLGGNQSNMVNIQPMSAMKLISVRRVKEAEPKPERKVDPITSFINMLINLLKGSKK